MLKIRKSSHHTPYASVPHFQENTLTKKSIYNIQNSCTQQLNEISSTKYIQQNMLNKLLRVPVKKQNKGQLRKYDPQFVKPDIEKLNHENIQFKNKINEDQKIIKELKFKVKELTRKIQKLQINCVEQQEDALEKNKKNSSVHTEILKKKIHELHIKFINAETQIKRLKKLPNASIYEQNNIQKQHLLAENIRLKSMLTSYETLNPSNYSEQNQINTSLPPSINNNNFQQQFLRMLKQQNEKLKATIRLLQNDKILMKARQTTQNKQTNDLKKQLQNARNKFILKQAQIQKLTHQNQNLLFKKATKFRLQKQQKQNQLILQLTKNIEQLRSCIKKLQSQKSQLEIDNLDLKKKQQNKNNELIEKDKQLEKLKIQLAQIRNQYDVRIKSLQMNKFYSKDSNFGTKNSKGKVFELMGYQFEKEEMIKNGYNNQPKFNRQDQPKKKFNWGKPIKFEQLDLCLLKIWALKENGIIINFQDIFNRFTSSQTTQDPIITFQQLYNILKFPPLSLTSNQSLKLSKYIFSDHSDYPNPSSLHPNQPVIRKSLAFTIIKAAVSQFTECLLNPNVLSLWKCFLSRSRKFIRQLEDNQNQVLNKQQFMNILLRNKNSGLQFEEINFMVLHGFQGQSSNGEQIMLGKKKLVECLEGLMSDSKFTTSVLLRSHKKLNSILPNNLQKQNLGGPSIMRKCAIKQQIDDIIDYSNKAINNTTYKNYQSNTFLQHGQNKKVNNKKNYHPRIKYELILQREMKQLNLEKVKTLSSGQKLHSDIFDTDNQNELKILNKNQLKKQKQQHKNNQPLEKQKNNKGALIQTNNNNIIMKSQKNCRFEDENFQDNESNNRDDQEKTVNFCQDNQFQKYNRNNMQNNERQVQFSELNEGDFNQLLGQIQMEEQQNELQTNYQNVNHNQNFEQQQQDYEGSQQNQDQQSLYVNL